MPARKNIKQTELFSLSKAQFALIFLLLFSLVFASAAFLYADPIYVALLRKYYAPKVERDFGFSKGIEVFNYDGKRYEYFAIQSVTPNGVLDKAGFKPHDAPIDWGCKFNEISRTNEAIFYKTLMNASPEEEIIISVIDLEEFKKSAKPNDNPFYYERKIKLKAAAKQN